MYLACSRPVIAYAGGGVLDSVVHNETGFLFAEQSVNAIIQAVEAFDPDSVSPARCRQQAERFDTAVFQRELTSFVERKLEEHRNYVIT
jgi:glycosyltransferase involved in cell wall biosynthesis